MPCPFHPQERLLLSAVASGDVPLVAELLAARADPNAAAQGGLAALHLAALAPYDNGQLYSLLVSAGAALNAPSARLGTPLHAAVAVGSAEHVEWLCAQPAIVIDRTHAGNSPLVRALSLAELATARARAAVPPGKGLKGGKKGKPKKAKEAAPPAAAALKKAPPPPAAPPVNSLEALPAHARARIAAREDEAAMRVSASACVLLARGADVRAPDARQIGWLGAMSAETRKTLVDAAARQSADAAAAGQAPPPKWLPRTRRGSAIEPAIGWSAMPAMPEPLIVSTASSLARLLLEHAAKAGPGSLVALRAERASAAAASATRPQTAAANRPGGRGKPAAAGRPSTAPQSQRKQSGSIIY